MGGTASRASELSSSEDPQNSSDTSLSQDSYPALDIDDRNNSTTEHIVPTEFKWSNGGYSVYITGAWDDWSRKTQLSRTHPTEFATVLALPVGTFQYKFIVDGNWKHNPLDSTARDPHGNLNNVITVSAQPPEYDSNEPLNVDELSRSPMESYNYTILEEEDHTTEAPSLPRILSSAPIDRRPRAHLSGTDFVRLNHLYLIHGECSYGPGQTRTMATERRFKDKVITTVLLTTSGRFVPDSMSEQPYGGVRSQPIPIPNASAEVMSESHSLLLDALNNV
ncbi:unnamed protein product [Agarophyton chilense]|eukprot:gb/GEZJ01004796.1/.p1 GENE.gb/GEZJ01004796.1/~~gb/GEZJ01004796.1/.p1  ORF type:complete len:279 (-),score=17.61 gb/GEZJ01004796.1/:859-1695(-)